MGTLLPRHKQSNGCPVFFIIIVRFVHCLLCFAASSQRYDATLTPTASKHSITRYSENYNGSKPTAIGLLRRSRKHIHTSDGWLCCRWKPAWHWAVVWWWWWGCTYADVEGLSSHSSLVPRCSTVTHPKVLNLTRVFCLKTKHTVFPLTLGWLLEMPFQFRSLCRQADKIASGALLHMKAQIITLHSENVFLLLRSLLVSCLMCNSD